MSYSFLHFSISQAINLTWASLVWFVLFYAIHSEGIRNAMEESFLYIFIYLAIVAWMFLICWYPKYNCQTLFIIMSIIGFISGSLFIGLFFGIFFKPLNYTYLPSKNCTITRINAVNFDNAETYVALNIEFKNIQGKLLNGYGCASNKKKSDMISPPYVYSYYERDEKITCNNSGELNYISLDNEDSINYSSHNRRILQYDDSDEYYDDEDYDSGDGHTCTYVQDKFDVKLSPWHCLDLDEFQKELSEKNGSFIYENCYYTIYGDEIYAWENAYIEEDLYASQMSDFYMVIFDNPPYYDKLAFQLIIGFCFIPFLSFTQFCWIPQVAKKLEPKILQFFQNISQQKPQTQQNNQEQNKNNIQSQQSLQKQEQKPRKNSILDSEEVFQEKQQNLNISSNSLQFQDQKQQQEQYQNNNYQQNNNLNQIKPKNNYNFDNIDNQYDSDQKDNNNIYKNIILQDKKY